MCTAMWSKMFSDADLVFLNRKAQDRTDSRVASRLGLGRVRSRLRARVIRACRTSLWRSERVTLNRLPRRRARHPRKQQFKSLFPEGKREMDNESEPSRPLLEIVHPNE
jgi:hypothetical protein